MLQLTGSAQGLQHRQNCKWLTGGTCSFVIKLQYFMVIQALELHRVEVKLLASSAF